MFRLQVLLLLFVIFSASVSAQSEDSKITAEFGKTVRIPAGITPAMDEVVVSVIWKMGEERIAMRVLNRTTYTEPRAILDADNSLRLFELNFTDAGIYSIDIVTYNEVYSAIHEVEILASPDVTAHAIPVVDDGSGAVRMVAQCEAKGGSDSFSIDWYEDDTVLVNGTASTDSVNSEMTFLTDSSLPLTLAVSALEDNGRVVTCVVTDAFGRKIERPVALIVTEPTTTVPTTTMQAKPMITKFPRDEAITLVLGKSRGMTCRATGVPDPTVAWYKDNKMINSGIGESKIDVVADEYSKGGIYMCKASSHEGVDQKGLKLEIQGPPVIVGADELENGTEKYVLNTDDEFVSLVCQSDAYPIPEIQWEVDGGNFSALEKSHKLDKSSGRVSSYLNISASHFSGENSISKIICTAKNHHGDARKEFIVSVPIASSKVGVIIGVAIVLLLVIIILVSVTVYCVLVRKQQGTMTTSAESGGPCPLSTCCGEQVKSKELKEEDDLVTVEHVKEVDEEGTQEEKRKLTDAEEVPATKQEEKCDEQKESKQEEEKNDEEKSPKKTKISLPMQCCRGNRKEKEEDTDEPEEQTGDNENEAGNGKTQTTKEAERDSGKGDTLEKVVEEESSEK